MMGGVNKGRLFVLLGKWFGRLMGGVPSHSESGQHVCTQHSIAIKTFSLYYFTIRFIGGTVVGLPLECRDRVGSHAFVPEIRNCKVTIDS
jgi:hypothetical protein